ncbi:MAG TPA: hypothetical protein PLL23_01640 [Chitinophagaceae bacterium]|nr:hypothetical protein [Chitinophagaceae bacterium]
MKRGVSLFFTFLVASFISSAQKRSKPFIFSIFNEATAIPFNKVVTTPFHPGLEAGSGFSYTERKHKHLFQTFILGYVYHQNLYHGFYFKTQLNYDVKLNFGLNLKAVTGIGYLHTFSTQREYVFEDGGFESGYDKGNSRFMFSLGTGLGYRIRKRDPYSPELFVMYQGWVEYPFSPGFIPLMTHTNLQLGAKVFYHQY